MLVVRLAHVATAIEDQTREADSEQHERGGHGNRGQASADVKPKNPCVTIVLGTALFAEKGNSRCMVSQNVPDRPSHSVVNKAMNLPSVGLIPIPEP